MAEKKITTDGNKMVLSCENPTQEDLADIASVMGVWQDEFSKMCDAVIEQACGLVLTDEIIRNLAETNQMSVRDVKMLLNYKS